MMLIMIQRRVLSPKCPTIGPTSPFFWMSAFVAVTSWGNADNGGGRLSFLKTMHFITKNTNAKINKAIALKTLQTIKAQTTFSEV